MKLVIDETDVKKSGLKLSDILYLTLIFKRVDLHKLKKSLRERGLISLSSQGLYLTDKGKEKLFSVDKDLPNNIDYVKLAEKLREIYPEGIKGGTTCMWRDSVEMIARKLRTLVTKYNCSFTEEQAIKVTQDYVDSFNGDYTYMQVLKYFLLKTITFQGGDREVSSEFMSRIENYGQDNIINKDWTSDLI